MRSVYTLIIAGFVSLIGCTVHAQTSGDPMDDLIKRLTTGGSGASVGDILGDVTQQLIDTTGPTQQVTSAIEGSLVVVEEVTPEVNKPITEIIDSRTNRYPPRLKINFAEFPLRSLEKSKRTSNGNTGTNIIAQRIQSRLRLPQVNLVVQDRTAIVTGTVSTGDQRRLVESMLRFEPGIDTVKNEIIVTPAQ